MKNTNELSFKPASDLDARGYVVVGKHETIVFSSKKLTDKEQMVFEIQAGEAEIEYLRSSMRDERIFSMLAFATIAAAFIIMTFT